MRNYRFRFEGGIAPIMHICELLTESSNNRNRCARFVSHSLTDALERADVEHCEAIIKTAWRNICLGSIATGGGTSCLWGGPSTKSVRVPSGGHLTDR